MLLLDFFKFDKINKFFITFINVITVVKNAVYYSLNALLLFPEEVFYQLFRYQSFYQIYLDRLQPEEKRTVCL